MHVAETTNSMSPLGGQLPQPLLTQSFGHTASHLGAPSTTGPVLLGALIGFVAAVLVALLTEWFARIRARRDAFNESLREMEAAASIYMAGIPRERALHDVIRDYTAFARSLGRARSLAKWPVVGRNRIEIQEELRQMQFRLVLAIAKYRETAEPPRFGPIIGERLSQLFGQTPWQIAEIDDVLAGRGYPPMREWGG